MMEDLASFLANPSVVWAVAILLLLWASLSAGQLQLGVTDLRRALEKAQQHLDSLADPQDPQKFTESFDDLAAKLNGLPLLGPRWREFRGSLLIPTEQDTVRIVRASTPPAAYFQGAQLLRGAGLDLRYHAAMPNLLVGAGLFFTFLGLAAALSTAGAIVAEGATQAQRNADLKRLLDTASFKFITSLVGLALSIAYTLIRKRSLQGVEQALDQFLARLETLIPLATPATLQLEANRLLTKQNTRLETFSNELAVAMGGVIDTEIKKPLIDALDAMKTALNDFGSKMSSLNTSALNTMVEKFLQQLKGATGDSMREIATTLQEVGGTLKGMEGGLQQAAQTLNAAAQHIADAMTTSAKEANRQLGELFENIHKDLEELLKQIQQAGRTAGEQIQDVTEAAAKRLQAAAEAASAAVEKAGALTEDMGTSAEKLRQSLDAFQEAATQATTPLTESASGLQAVAVQAHAAVQQLGGVSSHLGETTQKVTELAVTLDNTQQRIRQLLGTLDTTGARFEGLDQQLARTLDRLQEGLRGFTEQVSRFVSETDTNLAKAANATHSVAQELEALLGEFVEATRKDA